MDDKYYILINSDQLGPYSAADLSGLLSDGVITRLTPLKSDDRDSWFTVGDVLPESPSQSSSLGSLPAHAPKPPAPTPSAVSKPLPSPESLMVHVSRDGQQFGPYKYSDLNGMLMTGELNPNDLAWHEGLSDWLTLRALTVAARPHVSSGEAGNQNARTSFAVRFGSAFAIDEFGFVGKGSISILTDRVELAGSRSISLRPFFMVLSLVVFFLVHGIAGLVLALVSYFCLSDGVKPIPKTLIREVRRDGRKVSFRSKDKEDQKDKKCLFVCSDESQAKAVELCLRA